MISAVRWIPAGACLRVPERYEISPEELAIARQATTDNDAAESSGVDEQVANLTEREFLDALHLDNYDRDDAAADRPRYMAGDDIVVSDDDLMDAGDLSDLSDREDYELKDDDRICLVARADDDEFSLEMQVYDPETGSLFVHHDFMLPSFPLCLQWLNRQAAAAPGSFVAVGTFQPEIELWNLDVIDVLEPVAVLSGHHSDAVMSLSWTPIQSHLMASGSADHTVALWDLTKAAPASVLRHHKDKVQALQWHPVEPRLLASGAYDRRVRVVDCRTGANPLKYKVAADVEQIQWNVGNPAIFAVTTEDGRVRLVDVRRGSGSGATLLEWQAHQGSCTALAFSARSQGLVATGGADKAVNVWDVSELRAELVAAKDLRIGDVFALDFNREDPMLLAAGGSGGVLALWHIDENEQVAGRFASAK